jgi:hypothetical protein
MPVSAHELTRASPAAVASDTPMPSVLVALIAHQPYSMVECLEPKSDWNSMGDPALWSLIWWPAANREERRSRCDGPV